jgi:hypothetical protein
MIHRRIALLTALGLLAIAFAAWGETLTLDAPETAAICGYRVLWDTPILAAPDGVRVVRDEKVKGRGGTAPFAMQARDNGARPAALAFDAVHRYLLVRFPGAAEAIAAKLRERLEIAKAELVLPFDDEEVWPEGDTNWVPPGGGYLYRANWGTDALYQEIRPTWHAVAWGLRRPWKADAKIGPTYNAFISGAGYWKHFGAQDETADRVATRFGPTPVNHEQPDGRMDITAALTDAAFGDTLGTRLRRLADCGFLVRKWETYDHRYYTGCYEWSTGTGPRAIVIRRPSLVVTFAKAGAAAAVELPPAADVDALAAALKRSGEGGEPTAVMPSAGELETLADRLRFRQRPDMPDWQWQRIQELFAAAYGPGARDEPFWYEFVPSHVKGRLRGQAGRPDPLKLYEYYVDSILGKPYRGWHGFEAGPVLVTWFIYRDALPLPAQEMYRNDWTAWLMPDRETAPLDRQRDINCLDGSLVHPMVQDDRVGKGPPPNPRRSVFDNYWAATGDWRGNKSFYRSGFNYMMSTVNFNNTASMGALLGGAVIGSERAIADGRHGQAMWPLKQWTWYDGSSQEEGDDYYFGVTMRAQKMVADFGPDVVDRLFGRSMLLKSMTMLAETYHPALRRYITGCSRSAPCYRLVTQDGLYSILHTLSRRGTLTDLDTPAAELPEGEPKFGREFPPEQVARTAAYSSYAPAWYQHVIDEKPLPFEVTSTFKRWGAHVGHPLMKRTFLGRNFGAYTISLEEGFIAAIAQWRRTARPVGASRELGSMFMRMGINRTRFVNDGPGWAPSYGSGAMLQHGATFIASYSPWGPGLDARRNIKSVQASLGFYNYELPAPTWELYVDGRRVTALPYACKAGQRIAIRDGVTYIGITPLPGSDLGRTEEVVLREGEQQDYLNSHKATAALVIDAYILQRDEPLGADADWEGLDKAATGFAVEFADAEDYADFAAFLKHLESTRVTSEVDTSAGVHNVAYTSGEDTLEMGAVTLRPNMDLTADKSFTHRRVNGQNPDLPAGVERISPFSIHATSGRLERGGAVLRTTPGRHAVLQAEPNTGTVLAANPLAELSLFSLRTAGDVEITADGGMGITFVTFEAGHRRVVIEHAFLPEQAALDEAADTLLLFGLAMETPVVLNGHVMNALARIDLGGRQALIVPLKQAVPDATTVAARYRSAVEVLGAGR